MKGTDGMFTLSTILPGLRGQLAGFIEQPLRRGVAEAEAYWRDAGALLIEYRVQFDYDSTWDEIGRIDPFATTEAALDALPTAMQASIDTILKSHASWRVIEGQVHEADVLPATGNLIEEEFPVQLGTCALGEPAVYDKLYLRYYLLNGADGDLLGQLSYYSGLQYALIDHLQQLGEGAQPVAELQ